jgi:hypothetical protein
MVTTKMPEIWQCVQNSRGSVNEVSTIFLNEEIGQQNCLLINLGGWGIQNVAVI